MMNAHQPRSRGVPREFVMPVRRWLDGLDARRLALFAGSLLAVLVALAVWRANAGGVTLLSSPPAADDTTSLSLAGDDGSSGAAGYSSNGADPGVLRLGGAAGLATPGSLTSVDIYVHISGAVVTPGVVCLPAGSRLVDGTTACGGLAEDAATDYINLAAVLEDGTHMHIPRLCDIEALREQGISPEQELLSGSDWNNPGGRGASGGAAGGGAAAGAGAGGGAGATGFPVDINNADSTALQTVPGIGPVMAQRIIDYRSQHGPFTRLEDLMLVSGIGQKKFANMQPYLTCQ